MADGGRAVETLPLRELTTGDCLDLGFAFGRGAWRGRGALLPVGLLVATAALVAALWSAFRSDLIASQGREVHPATLRAATVAALALELAQLLVGTLAVRHLYAARRGPLDPPPAMPRLVLATAAFAPLWILALHAGVLAWSPGAVLEGTASLLPLEASSGRLSGPQILFAVLYWLVILPYLRLVPTVIAVEGRGVAGALRRGVALAIAARGRLHGLQVMLGLVTVVLAAGLAVVLLGVFGDPAFAPAGDALPWRPGPLSTALTAAFLLVATLLTPAAHLVFLLAYLDVRVRAEGLDVERDGRLARLLPGSGAA